MLASTLLAALAGLAPVVARAAEYETFVDIDDEDDLVELNTAGDISAETFDTLVELLRRGVDLNAAQRDELFTLPNLSYAEVDALLRYRNEVGFIDDPAMLVKAGVLDADTLKSIAAFIYIVEPGRRYAATSGKIRLRTATTVGDRRVPATVLDGQVQTLRHLSLGFAGVLLRDRVSDVRYDPVRNALSAEAPRPQVALPKFFVQWDTDQWAILAGTYRAGFGQRLTFDNTRNYTPNGFYRDLTIYPRPVRLNALCNESTGELAQTPCQGDVGNSYGTPDFRWQETLQGMAVGLKRLDAGIGWLQAYAFMSVKGKTAYQYQLYDPAICEDPRNDDDPRCDSPGVYKRQPDPYAPTSEFAYQKLPQMYRDTTAGGNVSYFFNRRSWVGVTGYGTDIQWQTGKPLGFQEWARTPFGGPFGAVGVNASWGKRWSDLGVELTRSFDSMKGASGSDKTDARGGGGYGAILRHTAAWGRHEIETVVRYYDRNFANPYARPLAGNDVYEGQRARDEAGFRVRYSGRPHKKTLVRAFVNFWVAPSTRTPLIHVLTRVEHQVTRWWTPGVWFEARDKNLGVNGPANCYGGDLGTASSIDSSDVEGIDPDQVDVDYANVENPNARCPGESIKYNIQSAFFPHKRVKLVPRFQHRFIGDPESNSNDGSGYKPVEGQPPPEPGKPRTGYRQDISAWLTISTRPIDPLRVRARVRYQNWAIDDNKYLEHSLWSYFDVGYMIKRAFLVQLRYDLYVWLDKRPSTLARIPSPEHRLMLTLEGRF